MLLNFNDTVYFKNVLNSNYNIEAYTMSLDGAGGLFQGSAGSALPLRLAY